MEPNALKKTSPGYDRTLLCYYKDVGQTEKIDPKTERELFHRYQKFKDIEARDKLVGNCLRFVVKLARMYSRDQETFKDLISAGNVGIFRALERYNPKRKTRFLSYATYWILLEIRTELQNASLVSIPLWRQKMIRKIGQVKNQVEAKRGRNAEAEEICEETGLSLLQFTKLESGRPSFIPLDVPLFLPCEKSQVKDHACINKELTSYVHAAIKTLSPKEQYAVYAYFGFIVEPKSLGQIANVLGVTSERVRQIKAEALKKLSRVFRIQLRVAAPKEVREPRRKKKLRKVKKIVPRKDPCELFEESVSW